LLAGRMSERSQGRARHHHRHLAAGGAIMAPSHHHAADDLLLHALFECPFALLAMEDISYYSSDNDIDEENDEEDDKEFEKRFLLTSSASKTHPV